MNDLQQELINTIRKFRLDNIEPHAEHDDAELKFRPEIITQLGQLGFCGITTEENYGGAGLAYQDFCWVLEELSKSSVAYAVTVSVSSMVQSIIQAFGNENQKQKYLLFSKFLLELTQLPPRPFLYLT